MNFIKRGLLSIKGRPTKSILLLIIITLVSTMILGSFIVRNATLNLEDSIKNRLGAKATLKSDLDLVNHYSFTKEEIINNQDSFINLVSVLDEIQEIEGTIGLNYVLSGLSSRSSFVDVIDLNNDCNDLGEFQSCNSIQIRGFNNKNIFEFETSNINLIEGRMPSQEELNTGSLVALIENPQSYYRDLDTPIQIGDTLSIKTYINDQNDINSILDTNEFNVKIIGFVESETPNYSHSLFIPSPLFMEQFKSIINKERSLNENQISSNLLIPFIDHNRVYIKNIDSVESVSVEINQLLELSGLDEQNVRVITSSDEYNSIIGPVRNIENISSLLLSGTIIAGITIVSLLVILLLRERQKEIGILLAMGESFIKIFSQILFEVILISTLAIILSISTSKMLAGKLSSLMLENQISSLSQSMDDPLDLNNQEAILNEYEINLDLKDYLVMYSLINGIILVSIMPSCLYLSKLNPKEILI